MLLRSVSVRRIGGLPARTVRARTVLQAEELPQGPPMESAGIDRRVDKLETRNYLGQGTADAADYLV